MVAIRSANHFLDKIYNNGRMAKIQTKMNLDSRKLVENPSNTRLETGRIEGAVRKLEIHVKKNGPEVGKRLYHLLQSQAAHAGVSVCLRRKIDELRGRQAAQHSPAVEMFIFPESASEPETGGTDIMGEAGTVGGSTREGRSYFSCDQESSPV